MFCYFKKGGRHNAGACLPSVLPTPPDASGRLPYRLVTYCFLISQQFSHTAVACRFGVEFFQCAPVASTHIVHAVNFMACQCLNAWRWHIVRSDDSVACVQQLDSVVLCHIIHFLLLSLKNTAVAILSTIVEIKIQFEAIHNVQPPCERYALFHISAHQRAVGPCLSASFSRV